MFNLDLSSTAGMNDLIPVFQVFSLLIKTLSKPIAAKIKSRAQVSGRLHPHLPFHDTIVLKFTCCALRYPTKEHPQWVHSSVIMYFNKK